MELAPRAFERLVIVRLERRLALLFERAHLCLDGRLVDADDEVVLVDIDAERLAQGRQQMVFVHLRIALHQLLLVAVPSCPLVTLGNVAQLLNCLSLQLVIRVRHQRLRLKHSV